MYFTTYPCCRGAPPACAARTSGPACRGAGRAARGAARWRWQRGVWRRRRRAQPPLTRGLPGTRHEWEGPRPKVQWGQAVHGEGEMVTCKCCFGTACPSPSSPHPPPPLHAPSPSLPCSSRPQVPRPTPAAGTHTCPHAPPQHTHATVEPPCSHKTRLYTHRGDPRCTDSPPAARAGGACRDWSGRHVSARGGGGGGGVLEPCAWAGGPRRQPARAHSST